MRDKRALVVGKRMRNDVAQGRIAKKPPPLHVGDGERIGRSTPAVSWELDLWGNLRWAKRKGGAEYLASVEDRRPALPIR